MLLQKVERILEERNWAWAECPGHGCFDVAARKRSVMLVKVLENVDSFMPEQAKNLRILSERLDASAALVGERTRVEELDDNVVYERFEVPTLTAETLEVVLDNNSPDIFRARGGLFSEISSAKLRRARTSAGLTQAELAEKVGITKKAVYQHESGNMRMRREIAVKIEEILEEDITLPFRMEMLAAEKGNAPRNNFELRAGRELRRIGFDTDFVHQSPFNIVASERIVILSDAEPLEKVKRKAAALAELSEVTKKPAIAITEKEASLDIPSIPQKSLKGISSSDLKKLAK